MRQTCINGIVVNSTKMFTRTRKEIVIRRQLQDDIWSVRVDPGQIEQVLINLYLNAWHAMPQGGDICIQTENVYLSDHYCKPFEVPGGNYVKVSMTDTGVGISEESLKEFLNRFLPPKTSAKAPVSAWPQPTVS